mgnify:CR=1 FL=1
MLPGDVTSPSVTSENATAQFSTDIISKAAESVKETAAAGENASSTGEETIRVTHKRFYIDESGKQCIADTFDGVDAFLDGYAVVRKAITGTDGKKDVEWGIIKR